MKINYVFLSVAPPDISVEKTWIHAAEECDVQLMCTLHGDVNSEVSLNVITFLHIFLDIYKKKMENKFSFSPHKDDVVPELVPFGPHRPSNDVLERRQVYFEHHKLPAVGFRKLQVNFETKKIDYKPFVLTVTKYFPTVNLLCNDRKLFCVYALPIDLIICCRKVILTNLIN